MKILKKILANLYIFLSIIIIAIGIMFPIVITYDLKYHWIAFIIYPLVIIIISTQDDMIKWCNKVT